MSTAIVLFFLGLVTVASAQNQYVILYPGAANPTSTDLEIYTPIVGGLQHRASVTVPPGTFQFIPTPDGLKYYLFSTNGAPVSVLDSGFQSVQPIASAITQAPTAAALTPDGTKLLVLAGSNLYVIQTSSDTVLNPGGLPVCSAAISCGNGIDLAVSIDSQSAYVLSAGTVGSATGTGVTAFDISQATPVVKGTTLTLANDPTSPPTGMVLSPAGFLYVTNNYRLFEIDPTVMKVTTNGEIPIQAYPGKPLITPDGQYVVMVNERPSQGGTLLIVVAIATKTVSSIPTPLTVPGSRPAAEETLVKLYPEGADISGTNHLYGLGASGWLYDLTISSTPSAVETALDRSLINGQTNPPFTGVAFSSELPPTQMYLTNTTTPGQLFDFDLTGHNSVSVGVPNSSLQLGTLGVGPSTGGTLLSGFNNNQVVAAGAQSALPIVARLTDPQGRGIYRGQITFTGSTGVVIATPTFVTGSGGYAQTYFTAPSLPGTYTITATAFGSGVNPLTFTFTVPGIVGGGGTVSQGGLVYKSGDGQLILDVIQSSPMVVQVLDASGNPVSGSNVTFSLVSGPGALEVTNTTSDINGLAYTYFQPGTVNAGFYYQPSTIQATSAIGAPINFTITSYIAQKQDGSLAGDPAIYEDQTSPSLLGPSPRTITATAGSILKGEYSVFISGNTPDTSPIQYVGIRATNNHNTTVCNPFSPDYVATDPTTCESSQLPNTPYATCLGGTTPAPANDPLSDGRGRVTCDLQIGSVVGTGQIWFVIGEKQTLPAFTLVVSPGLPSQMTILNGNNQSAKPGTALPVQYQVKVTDASGNGLGGQVVNWTVTPANGAALSATSSTTNTNGVAVVNVTLGNNSGTVTIQGTLASNSKLFSVFTATSTVVVATVTPVSGDNQNTFTSTQFANPVVVIVKDVNGNPVPNATVTFAATLGAIANPATVTTGSDGTASSRITAGGSPGSVLVSATASGIQAIFSNLSVSIAGPQLSAASFLTAGSMLPGLTPCGLSVVQASGIAPGVTSTIQPTGFGPNPTSLGPVQSLMIGNIAAPLTYVSNINGVEQVGFQTPCDVPVGTTTVTMNVQGGTSTISGVAVSAYSPGMFTQVASDGNTYAVALRPDGSYIGPTNPAVQGEVIRVFVTGLGQTNPPISTNSAGIGNQLVTANIIGGVNNAGVLVVQSEYVAGQIGTYFVDMQIPTDSQTGPYQPIAVAVAPADGGPLIFGNGAYIPIAPLNQIP
ncbi:MAG TPA: Ig-like domain-containing protein [Bryobacteraceae bacterium]